MGHCAAVLSPVQVIVLGGFSTITNDFLAKAYIYDFSTGQWQTSVAGLGRLDSSCMNANVGGTRYQCIKNCVGCN